MKQEEAIHELEEARRTAKDRRSYEQYQAILLWYRDYPDEEIGDIIGRCPLTVHHYIEAYHNGGIEGLKRGASPGKPSKLSDAQQAELLVTIACKTPADVGFPARSNWTLSLAAQLIEREWDQSYTPKGVAKLFHSLGLTYTRPTYTLRKANPVEQEKFSRETFPDLKKN